MLQQKLISSFEYVDITEDIIYIRDLNLGGKSITNDAESVYFRINRVVFPGRRVVYQDSDGEWWEIIGTDHDPSRIDVSFKRWNGKVWDILTRKEEHE